MVNKATTSKNLATAINLAIDQKTSSLRVATFAIITQVNDNQTINAQPVTSQLVNNPHGAKRYVNLPEIQQIPYLLVSEPKAGDYCVLLHLDNPIKTQQYSGNYIPDKYIQIQINFSGNIAQSGTSGLGIISCNVFNLQGEQTAQLLASVAYANVNNYVSFTQEFSRSDTNGIEFTIENFQISGIPNVETIQLNLSITIPNYNNNKPISVKVPYLSVSGSTYTFQTTSQRVISTTSVKAVKDSARKHELDNCIALCGFKNLSANLELTEQDEEQAEQYDFKKYYENNIAEIAKTISDTLYPVGHIFLTNNSAYNPNGKLSGTWERLSSSAYLRLLSEERTANEYDVYSIILFGLNGLGTKRYSGSAITTNAAGQITRIFQMGYRIIQGIRYLSDDSVSIHPDYVQNITANTSNISVALSPTGVKDFGLGFLLPANSAISHKLTWQTTVGMQSNMKIVVTYLYSDFSCITNQVYSVTEADAQPITVSGTNCSIIIPSLLPLFGIDRSLLLISFCSDSTSTVTYQNATLGEYHTAGEFDGQNYVYHDTASAGASVFLGDTVGNTNYFSVARKESDFYTVSSETTVFESPNNTNAQRLTSAQLNGHISAAEIQPTAYNTYAWIRTK